MGMFARHVAQQAEPAAEIVPKGKEGLGIARHNAEHAGTRDARKQRFATLLVGGKSIPEIAKEMGIDRGTAYTYAKDPDVRSEVRATFEARRAAVARELDGGTLEAVRFLRETLADPLATNKERIRCAVELLDRGGFGRGVKLDVHNVETGTTIEVEDVSALSDEEIEIAARAALERRARIKVASS